MSLGSPSHVALAEEVINKHARPPSWAAENVLGRPL
jgi:hypothetical protein